MGKQKKHLLQLDLETGYEWIGLCSHHQDYRLAWGINDSFEIQLQKQELDFEMHDKKNGLKSTFPWFLYDNELDFTTFCLIKNKGQGKLLIPEKNQIDFWFVVMNNNIWEINRIIEKLRNINSITGVYHFAIESIPNAQSLFFQ